MTAIVRTPKAEADLDEILTQLDQRNPTTASRYADAFAAKAAQLSRFPESGRERTEIAPGLRSTLVPPYVIFYRLGPEVVEILRIIHGRRDLFGIMRDEE